MVEAQTEETKQIATETGKAEEEKKPLTPEEIQKNIETLEKMLDNFEDESVHKKALLELKEDRPGRNELGSLQKFSHEFFKEIQEKRNEGLVRYGMEIFDFNVLIYQRNLRMSKTSGNSRANTTVRSSTHSLTEKVSG